MWKPASVGFLAGALVAGLCFKFLQRRDAAEQEAARAVAAEEAGRRLAAAEAETAGEREKRTTAEAAGAKLRSDVQGLKERLAARPAEGGGGGTQGRPPRSRRSMADLAAVLAGLNATFAGRNWESWPKEAKDLQGELMELMNQLAAEMGVTPDEAMRSPRGMSLLLLELLARMQPPLDAAQEARLRELLATQDTAWQAWLDRRGDQSALEQRRDLLALVGPGRDAFLAELTPEQRGAIAGYGLLEMQIQGSQSWLDGPRAQVTGTLTAQWSSALGLNENQTRDMAPLVTEYIDRSRALNDEIWNRRYAGEDLSREADYAMRVQLMIETQKKISDTLRLTDDQAKAMKEWGFTYGVNLTDGQAADSGK